MMEIQFQQPKQQQQHQKAAVVSMSNKRSSGKFKGRGRSRSRSSNTSTNTNNRFVGVRQRPSGRWVAEIKDTTQDIRMWLGTFQTAEEAAMAYDEAACLLRGSNTRTNFITPAVSLDSPLASRIRNLLNSRKPPPPPAKHKPSSSSSTLMISDKINDDDDDDDDGYRPDLSNFKELGFSHESNPSSSWGGFGFGDFIDGGVITDDHTVVDLEISEFERMKVERQISASLYAINGVHEYMETVQEYSMNEESLWDLPPLGSILSTIPNE